MKSYTIPKVALLSEKEQKSLTALLEKLCSETKIALLDKQIRRLNQSLKNIRSFNEVSYFNRRLVIIKSYLAFAETLLAYAATQEIAAPSISASISNLSTRFAALDAEEAANNSSIEFIESAHPSSLERKGLKKHTRTGSKLGKLIKSLAELDEDQTHLLAKMAEVANDLLSKELVFEVIDAQLKQLPKNEISAFYNADMHIRLAKTEKQLDGYCNSIKNWLTENNVMLNACEKSLSIIKIIDIHLLSKLNDDEIKPYKALVENKELARNYLTTASSIVRNGDTKTHIPITNPIINKINRIFDFQTNIDTLQAERKQALQKEATRDPNSPSDFRLEHKRERSKSQNYIAAPAGTKFKFFALDRNKANAISTSTPEFPRQYSAYLPTYLREAKNTEKKQPNSSNTPSKR